MNHPNPRQSRESRNTIKGSAEVGDASLPGLTGSVNTAVLEKPAGSMIGNLLAGMRPHQWVKNGFLFAPLVFSHNLFHVEVLLTAVAAFFLYSLTASAVYLGNDVLDVEADRRHPVKRHRAIASGRLPIPVASTAAVLLLLLSLGASIALSIPFAIVVGCYLVMNLLYSWKLKKIAYVDVAIIALGFVLRVLAGALAIGVPTSHWLFVCTFALALFLGLGKRKHEILVAQEDGHDGAKARKALKGYDLRHVNLLLLGAGSLAVLSYLLYTIAPETYGKFNTYALAVTMPFPAFGVWRFNRLVGEHRRASSPTEALITDPPFVANLGLWLISVVVILYSAIQTV